MRGIRTLSLAAAGCGGTEEVPSQPEVSTPAEQHEHEEEGGVSAMAFDGPCAHACDNQCVDYARCRAPGLPYGLFDLQDKLAIMNSNHAHKGCVAVIQSSNPAGHVAFVQNVETAPEPNRITIHESNWVGPRCSEREGTKAGLNIRGYWCPRGVHTANCAGPM